MLEVVGAHRMRVQLEAGHVGHPREVGRVRGTTSSALRPDGKRIVATSSSGGRLAGARFWKKNSPAMPSG
jgi:hypothetical protein